MRCVDTNHTKNRIARCRRLDLIVLALCLIVASGSLSLAQSGRNQTPSPKEPVSPKSVQPGKDNNKGQGSALAFIVVTAAARRHEDAPYVGYSPRRSFEDYARGGCLVELKSIPGAKVIEDEEVAKWEARETALSEDKAWVIWMELRWNEASSSDSAPFTLRYLLFEPGTGKIVSSGYGNGIRRTWGTQPRRTTLEEQLREAGRDIATQVMSELTTD